MSKEADKFLRDFAASVGNMDSTWRKALSKAEAQGLPDVANFKLLELIGKLAGNDLNREERFKLSEILYNVVFEGLAEQVVPGFKRGSGRPKYSLNEALIIYQHVERLKRSGKPLKDNTEAIGVFELVADHLNELRNCHLFNARKVERNYYVAKAILDLREP